MIEELVQGIQFILARHDLRLANPDGLLLLLAIPVFVILGFWMGRDLRWYRRWLIQLLRAAGVAALAVSLAQPVEIKKQDAPAVVMLADLSDSMSADARERMEDKIRQFWKQRGEATTYLVGFGKEPVLLARPGSRRVGLPGSAGSDGTDIAAALRFTYGLFPARHDRRVVLFSDGEETRGDLRAEAARARDFDIEVSAVPIIPESSADVRADKLVAPSTARAGDKITVQLQAYSSSRRRAGVRLLLDGKQVERRVVTLNPGANQIDFTVGVEAQGLRQLTARIQARDRYPQNNWVAGRVFVHGRPQVLLVQPSQDPNPLRSLLQSQDIELRTVSLANAPAGFGELAKYDLVILDDLSLAKLPGSLAENLKTYVEEFGGGLLVSAGQAASELAGPDDFPIEKVLPVEFRQVKKKEKIPAALVFVMDRSSSMNRHEKFSILLRAVVDALERMKDNTHVSMVMFDDFPEVVVPLTEAKQREKIKKVLLSQRVGGGTSIYPALEAAHKELKKSAAKLKHVILLSDGQSISIYAHYGYIVEKIAKDRITVTTVALGEDADQPELKRVAGRSGGRFYFTDSMDNVPKIFTAETENLTESNVVEQPIRAIPAKLVEVLAGIDFAAAPPLKGYLASFARPTSEVLLKSSDRGEPLLVRWRFGLGRVCVLTSDAQGAWSQAWTKWAGFRELWPRLVKDSIRGAPPGDIRLSGKVEEDRAILTVRVPAERPGDSSEPPKLYVYDPAGREKQLPVVRRGLGIYRGDLELAHLGPYAVRAERQSRRGAKEFSYASLSRTYREEYLSGTPNPDLLRAVARATGGKLDPEARELFTGGRQEREQTKERWPPFLFAALCLFLLEVFFRRI